MEVAQSQQQMSPLGELPDFISVAERGYHHIGCFSFPTSIIDHEDVSRYVAETLDEIGVPLSGAGWGEDGLVLDFRNKPDLSFFSLAFRGPRER
jgi:hypothetical protein